MTIFWMFLGLSVLIGLIGIKTRFGFWGNFFASMLLTPLIGFLFVIAARPKAARRG